MRFNLLAVFAALTLVSACASNTQSGGTGGSDGSSVAATSSAPQASATVDSVDPGSESYFVSNVGDRVFFGLNESDITDEGAAVLSRQAAWLRTNSNVTIQIEGHADERGTREYNLALGERRGNAAREFLISQGVSTDRIIVVSYGKERPAALGSNEAAWSQNRRAVTVLMSGAN